MKKRLPGLRTMFKRAGVVGSKRLEPLLLTATVLAVVVPGFADASPVPTVPDASYSNYVKADQPPPPGCNTACSTSTIDFNSTTLSTGGIGISASTDIFGNSYIAATDNNYTIPSVYAAVRATGGLQALAGSHLDYYIEFTGSGVSTVSVPVVANGQATAAADDVAGPPNGSSAGATATISIYNNSTSISLIFKQTSSDLLTNVGTHTLSIDQVVTFAINTVYLVSLDVTVGAEFNHSAAAFADPYFDLSGLPNGIAFLESNGIGNSLSDATPLPATLPLFATGLGAFGLLGWRKKRKGAALAAA